MAFVSIEDLKKSFGAVDVLTGINLDIDEGEFVVLVGPSGCGKSTLLRMIAGLEEVTSGDIHIDGRRVNDLEPRERDIAMVFQSYALYPHMTVRQNMAFNLKLRGEPEQVIKEKVQQAADILHLEELLQRYPRQLSGGQRQRVAMGRAIVRHPKVFLFDEPLSNLDAKLRVEMRTEIRKLHQSLRATSIYVTHDQVEAMTMADRIVVMNRGKIEQVGSPLDLYDNPANLFVAQFIGSPSINLVSGRVERRDGLAQVRLHDKAAIDFPALTGLPEGQSVTVGFRPEYVRIGDHGSLRGTVSIIEHLGPETFVYADVGGHQVCCRLPRTVSTRVGEAIGLNIDPERCHAFDSGSGLSLKAAG